MGALVSENKLFFAALTSKQQQKVETLNGRLPLEDSSDFDDSVCVLIVMTRSIILDTLCFLPFFAYVGTYVGTSQLFYRHVKVVANVDVI